MRCQHMASVKFTGNYHPKGNRNICPVYCTRPSSVCVIVLKAIMPCKSQKLCKQVKDKKYELPVDDGTELNSCYRAKVNSKAFAIPILTASAFIMFYMIAVRIRIANALEIKFCSRVTVEFHSIFNLFLYFLIPYIGKVWQGKSLANLLFAFGKRGLANEFNNCKY